MRLIDYQMCFLYEMHETFREKCYNSSFTPVITFASCSRFYSETCSKFIIKFRHLIRVSIDFAEVLRIENQIANEVIKHVDECGEFYIPSDLVKGRFIFCAAV